MNAPYQRHLQIGRQFFDSASFERAAREFEGAVGLEPEENYARLMLARCYLNLKRLKEARREVELALQTDPNDADAHYIGAYVAPNQKLALQSIDRALEIAPNEANYHRQRAFVLGRLNRFSLAIESAARALEIAPDDAASHRQMAGVLFDEALRSGRLSRSKRETATFHVEKALQIEPDNALSQAAGARLQGFALEYEEALEKWQEALRLDPTDEYAQNQLRTTREQARMARVAAWVWRILFRWIPWPLRLPLLFGSLFVSFYWGIIVPPGNGFLSDRAFLSVLSFPLAMLCALMTPLLLRDWLQWVPDRYLGALLHPLKKPPLR